MKICKICNKEFTPRIHNQVTCGGMCKLENSRRQTRENARKKSMQNTHTKQCEICDNTIHNAFGNRRFCDECIAIRAEEAKNKQLEARRLARREKALDKYPERHKGTIDPKWLTRGTPKYSTGVSAISMGA